MIRYYRNKKYTRKESQLLLLREGYSLKVKELNHYCFRIKDEEMNDVFWDWYHTTGTLVEVQDGRGINIGKYRDDEDVAILIRKRIRKMSCMS